MANLGNTIINGNLVINNDATLTGDLIINGSLDLNNLAIKNKTTTKDLEVSGTTTLKSTTVDGLLTASNLKTTSSIEAPLLTSNGDNESTLNLKTSTFTSYLKAYKKDASANNLVLFSGGNVILGAGESSETIKRLNYNGADESNEDMHIGADGILYFYSNAQNDNQQKTMKLDTNGDLTVPGVLRSNVMGQLYTAGRRDEVTGNTKPNDFPGLSYYPVYQNSSAYRYGNVIDIQDVGNTQIFVGWKSYNNNGTIPMFVRGKSDVNGELWSPWQKVYTTGEIRYGTGEPTGGEKGDIYFQYYN